MKKPKATQIIIATETAKKLNDVLDTLREDFLISAAPPLIRHHLRPDGARARLYYCQFMTVTLPDGQDPLTTVSARLIGEHKVPTFGVHCTLDMCKTPVLICCPGRNRNLKI